MFSLGMIFITPHAQAVLHTHGYSPSLLLERHQSGDYGDLSHEDRIRNHIAVLHQERLFSAYQISNTRIWVITEADRSYTTILLPSEY